MNNSEKLQNTLIYDYVSFTSKIHSEKSILFLLGLQDVQFENLKGFYGYRDRLYFEGISIHYNGRDDMGVLCEMSGTGCRTWEKYGNSDYDGLFSEIIDNYSSDADKRQMNLTRLDVAYNDFVGILDLPLLLRETELHNFVSRFSDWEVRNGNKGMSVNHGSKKSNIFIRCYDKRLEQRVEDKIDHWVRFEIQLRKECAFGFIKSPGNLHTKYFQLVNNYLRYIIPTNNVTNCSLLDTAPFWLNFVDNAEKLSVFFKPADNYNFAKLYGYVNNQLSGAISTYIDTVGVEQFLKDISHSISHKKLNPKYKELINCEPGSGLLEYLKAHNLE